MPELGRLRELWQRAKRGEGQVVTPVGEPGIGKSRLVEGFRRNLAQEPRFGFRYQCSPHHANRDLHPVIEQLRRAAGLADTNAPGAKLAKLETFTEHILFVSGRQPVFVVVEDAHWADPSMLDFMAGLMAAIARARVLLVITHRPELARQWPACSHLAPVMLSRVGRDEALAIARSVAGDAVAPEALDEVVARADGVPLFV